MKYYRTRKICCKMYSVLVCISFLLNFLVTCIQAQFGNLYISVPRDARHFMDFQSDLSDSCSGQSQCVPVSQCPLIGDLLDTSCFSSDKYFHRLNSLTCGHSSAEDLVCCPPGGQESVAQSSDRFDQECGKPLVRGADYDGIGSSPWVARIGFTNRDTGKVSFPCSGSIISKNVILTAAHCALAKEEGYKLSTVVIGEWDSNRSPDCNELFCAPPTQNLKVAQVVVHPGYEQKIFRHDIALVLLRENIQFTITAAPICLNDSPQDMVGERATLIGWGKLSGQTSSVSHQQRLEVPLVALSACERIFGATVPVYEGQLCAGGEAGRDACQGFGGAPLVIRRAGRYLQVGIVSFGSENCGSADVPSVYTNVAHYYRWIVENAGL